MHTEIVITTVSLTIYLILAAGTYLVFAHWIFSVLEKARMIRRLRARQRETREESELERKLRQSLLTALGYPLSPVSFLTFIAALFLAIFFIASRSMGIFKSLFILAAAVLLACLSF